MTESQNHKQNIMKIVEKGAFASKKFLAFLTTESMLCAMAIVALTKQMNLGWPLASFMLAIVLCMAFIAVSFNLSQAKTDSFVRIAALTTGKIPKNIPDRMEVSVTDSPEVRNSEPNEES